jgi:murein L,D-transpeptidase YafK
VSRIIIFLMLYMCLLPCTAQADENVVKILVYKSARELDLLDNKGTVVKKYKVALGGHPVGAKQQEGDKKTPEGLYKIVEKKDNSRFHKALRISYPEKRDIENAIKAGVLPGGDVMVHGLHNGLGWVGKWHLFYDKWTNGCIAVTNDEIDEIWQYASVGMPIEIKP